MTYCQPIVVSGELKLIFWFQDFLNHLCGFKNWENICPLIWLIFFKCYLHQKNSLKVMFAQIWNMLEKLVLGFISFLLIFY